ncbi:putative uncharacterized protein DDB_G0282133 [Acyrthosiphon pisum]|uniref:Uncharacterized protein n=1 Tax=Acyrthosiphon pisum TaxID=7029 RepID=A0A8R2D636_ACYPI|nr:putative uncharacterized protein DDB_G0282133 [Acyrthosiphon pisum]|eukprot:XP_016663128.1 PREDICTED: putative uncharacterized protein DDB_G0282133 [Acyrthosiphon pisum]
MSGNDENDSSMNKDLSKLHLSFHESSIELWRTQEMCRLKLKSIKEIERSTQLVTLENEFIEKQLHDTKSRINEVRENIVSFDNINNSLSETLAHLEIQYEKKKFTINKSKCEYEKQLFVRTELWKKEEERLNNIPEVKLLKIADSELENTKLEYEELLLHLKNLVEKIDIATKENDEKRNNIIIQYAKVYTEMMSLNKREENCKTLLMKLNTEFKEKCHIKNALLETQKNKINKVSLWSHTPSKFEPKLFDVKLNSLGQHLNPNLSYSSNYNHADFTYDKDDMDINNSYSNNKPKKNVTFHSFSEDKITLETSDENVAAYKNINTFLVETTENINNNSAQLKNVQNLEQSTIQCNKNNKIESKEMHFNNINNPMNDGDLNAHTNKSKTIDVQSDFEFKKPYAPVQDKNKINSTIIQPRKMKTNKIIHMDNNFNQEKVEALRLSMDSHNNDRNLIDKDHSQKLNSLKSIEQSNIKNLDSDNINIFNNSSQLHVNVSNEPQKAVPDDGGWNFCSDSMSQNSANSSFSDCDLSESYENTHDIGEYPDTGQFNFSNYFESSLDVTPESNFQGLDTPQQFGNAVLQPSQNKSLKKMNTNKNVSMNRTTSKASKDYIKPNKSDFLPSDQFIFKF